MKTPFILEDENNCCGDEEESPTVFALDEGLGCCEENYIVGPPGPPGPAGPAYPGGLQQIVTESGTIPINQIYTLINASVQTEQTLPPISSCLVNGVSFPRTVTNTSQILQTVLPYGNDRIMFNDGLNVPPRSSFTLLPTLLGWIII